MGTQVGQLLACLGLRYGVHRLDSPVQNMISLVVSYWLKDEYRYWLTTYRLNLNLPGKSVVRITDCPDMTSAVYLGC